MPAHMLAPHKELWNRVYELVLLASVPRKEVINKKYTKCNGHYDKTLSVIT